MALPRPSSSEYRSAVGRLGRATQQHGSDSPEARRARTERDLIALDERMAAIVDTAPAPIAEAMAKLRRQLPLVGAR